jgi:soluble lytic murein transglycosylase
MPLSYYMLHAFSRLSAVDGGRADAAWREGVRRAEEEPFAIDHQPDFERPGFLRATELLQVGDADAARAEIEALGLSDSTTTPELLWGVALLYAKAGATELSHRVARGLLTDWLHRWPDGDWSAAWQLAFPRPHLAIVQREGSRNGVPEYLIYGVMREESAFDAAAVSPADAYGLMQLILPTARHHAAKLGLSATATSLQRPSVNIALGARVLGTLLARFEDNPLLCIPGYNAGPGRPARWVRDNPHSAFDVWVERIPFRETRRYTKRVLASRAAYAYLYHREEARSAMTLPLQVSE